jgi:hypothetical protein
VRETIRELVLKVDSVPNWYRGHGHVPERKSAYFRRNASSGGSQSQLLLREGWDTAAEVDA